MHRRVDPTAAMPKNWRNFLRVDENKTKLFSFLSHKVALIHREGKEVYAMDTSSVYLLHTVLPSQAQADLEVVVPCSQEEADTLCFCTWQMLSRSDTRDCWCVQLILMSW